MRNLKIVIEQMLEIAPDLKPHFTSLLDSISYTAPEMMIDRWEQAAEILNDYAIGHPKANEIAAIFSDSQNTSHE